MVGALHCVVAAEGPILDLSNSAQYAGRRPSAFRSNRTTHPYGLEGAATHDALALLLVPQNSCRPPPVVAVVSLHREAVQASRIYRRANGS